MNLILLFPEDYVDTPAPEAADRAAAAEHGRVRLTGRRLDHVRSIHRSSLGDELCVGLLGGRIGTGKIVRLDDSMLEMEVTLVRDPPEPSSIELVLAMPRPLVLKRVLISATAMGVKRIRLIQAKRVERSFWNSKVLRDGKLELPLILGLEQARDTILPEVELRTRFKPFVEDELPGFAAGGKGLVAHPVDAVECPRNVVGKVTLVIGPEGGFVPYEIEKFRAAGFEIVSLGERILRVETAVPALLSRLG